MATAILSREQILRAITLRIFCALCFSLMWALLKLAASRGVVAAEMLFYRAAFALPVVLAWAAVGPGLAALRPVDPRAHLRRSAMGLTSILLTFQALIMLPLAEASTIGFTAPVFATVLGWLVLGERPGPWRWAAVAVGFAGVAVMLRPGQSSAAIPLLGVVVGLMSAFGQASVTVALRRMQQTEPVAAIVFWFMAAGTLLGLLLLPFFGRLHDGGTLLLLMAGGGLGAVAQIAMTGSLKAPIAVVMPFDYLQVASAALLGWLLFATVPTIYTMAGAALIAAAGLVTAWRERLHRQGVAADTENSPLR